MSTRGCNEALLILQSDSYPVCSAGSLGEEVRYTQTGENIACYCEKLGFYPEGPGEPLKNDDQKVDMNSFTA